MGKVIFFRWHTKVNLISEVPLNNIYQGTIVADLINDASTSTLAPTPPQVRDDCVKSGICTKFELVLKPPAPSQCYSELEDISDQIRCLGCKRWLLFYCEPSSYLTSLKAEELLQIEAFARVDSVPPGATDSSSLGKRSASVALEHLEPPVFKRPRTTIPSAEEPQPLLPDAETSSAANPSSARDIPFIIVSRQSTSSYGSIRN